MTTAHKRGMAYELAREVISSRIGNISDAINAEERKPEPNKERVIELEAEIVALARERETLDPEDEDSVRRSIVRHSRTKTLPEALWDQGR